MMREAGNIFRWTLALVIFGFWLFPETNRAAETPPVAGERAPDRYGMSVELASVFDPGHDISFAAVTAFGLFDYGKVWRQDRPKELCFKVEGVIGSTFRPEARTIASIGMMALYYVDRLATPLLRPYVEGGIGVIYTDFKVDGQGMKLNFNPQLGIGTELLRKEGHASFVALRLHHLSNANLEHDNRGINSLVLQAGRFF